MWRCGNSAKVWYEWCTTAPQVRAAAAALRVRVHAHAAKRRSRRAQVSPVHNPNGRSYFVGL